MGQPILGSDPVLMGTAQWGLLPRWSFTMFSTLERAGDGGGHKGGGPRDWLEGNTRPT